MHFPRPLNAEEKAVLWTILKGAGVPEIEALSEQLDAAEAINPCECGCPSIGIRVDPDKAQPVSYSGRSVAETPWSYGAIMVWVDDGWLSNLEIYGWEKDPPTEWPDPARYGSFEKYV